MNWLAFALGYAGVASFAFAMAPHHRIVFGRLPELRRARTLRLAGSALLAAALAFASTGLGWQVGLVTWLAFLAVSGFALTQLLAYAPRLALAPVAPLLLGALLVSIYQ